MNFKTAMDIGMPQNVSPEVTGLVDGIAGLLTLDENASTAVTTLLSNFSAGSLELIRDMTLGYDPETLVVFAESLRYEAYSALVHTVAKREVRALFVAAIAPVTVALVRQSEPDGSELVTGCTYRVPIEDCRRYHSNNYQTQLMDSAIKLGREVHKLKGTQWIPFARGMAAMQHFEQYRIDTESHDYDFAMMLGTNFDRVAECSDALLNLKGTHDSYSGYDKEVVRHMLDGASPALIGGFLG